ncbi:MFS transporter [Gordonia sp. PDNC005]|uniref:MFS transporter n=1 Tax=unclassified Gordonia (in: high G+C Gram-positive bacteria) TaxID=2657482 RepID=UPI001965C6B6|nr:MFS transporter [Gordonia sp. PDNC005]QRY61327.1 MFS transporter [Gordonia sp. PDNC005]
MALFAIRDYRRLFGAQVIALFGTGLATVALGLLAYDLAGSDAAAVLATALTIKMVLYVVIAPIAAAYVDRLPRRAFLVTLDVIRMAVVVALPFVTQVWQVYVLVALLQAASAAFTPTFQAVIPDVVTDEADFTRALSASQVAYTMESLLSPVLAAVALTFMSFNTLFVGTAVGFGVSALLVRAATVPNARPTASSGALEKIVAGVRTFIRTRELRGVMALNLVVASAGSIVVVNTVNLVRDRLGGDQAGVAWMLAASGLGTLTVALVLPRILDRLDSERPVMMTGAAVLVVATAVAAAAAVSGTASTPLIAILWSAIGAGMAAIVTPTGRVIRRVVDADDIPTGFAAQFSLSHAAWLLAYPIAGWIGVSAGLEIAWPILAAFAAIGAVAAVIVWPTGRPRPVRTTTPVVDAELVGAACACCRAV